MHHIICVHGTFSKTRKSPAQYITQSLKWWEKGSSFRSKLIRELSGRNVDADIAEFGWTGGYSFSDRWNASMQLSEKIEGILREHPSHSISVISHSHGGNIAADAILKITLEQRGRVNLVTMGTPFLRVFDRGNLRWDGPADVITSGLICLFLGIVCHYSIQSWLPMSLWPSMGFVFWLQLLCVFAILFSIVFCSFIVSKYFHSGVGRTSSSLTDQVEFHQSLENSTDQTTQARALCLRELGDEAGIATFAAVNMQRAVLALLRVISPVLSLILCVVLLFTLPIPTRYIVDALLALFLVLWISRNFLSFFEFVDFKLRYEFDVTSSPSSGFITTERVLNPIDQYKISEIVEVRKFDNKSDLFGTVLRGSDYQHMAEVIVRESKSRMRPIRKSYFGSTYGIRISGSKYTFKISETDNTLWHFLYNRDETTRMIAEFVTSTR